jgi:hypothetical protein
MWRLSGPRYCESQRASTLVLAAPDCAQIPNLWHVYGLHPRNGKAPKDLDVDDASARRLSVLCNDQTRVVLRRNGEDIDLSIHD